MSLLFMECVNDGRSEEKRDCGKNIRHGQQEYGMNLCPYIFYFINKVSVMVVGVMEERV